MSCLFPIPEVSLERNARRSTARGFTLVEIMVTLVVISILAGMTVVGLNAARETARLEQTRGLVSRINQVILNKWDEYRYRPLPVRLPPLPASPGNTPPQLMPDEAGRLRLLMLRDLMRMEMPDRGSDLFEDNGTNAVDSFAVFNGPPGFVRGVTTEFNSLGEGFDAGAANIAWPTSPQLLRYQATVKQALGVPVTDPLTSAQYQFWTAQNQSAECLYMLMSATTLEGLPALEFIAPYQVGDTDNDGLFEIVDAWGSPISWVRWPSGSESPTIDRSVADEFDIISSDWGARVESVEVAYSLTPQVISPGPDRQLGIRTTEMEYAPETPYRRMLWDRSFTDNTIGDHFYVDPYMRALTNGFAPTLPGSPPQYERRPGAYYPDAVVGRAFAADNISSFDL